MARSLQALADRPVTVLAGVGPTRQKGLEAMGIATVLDLVTYYPRRWIDRSKQAAIRDLKVGEEAYVLARVSTVQSRRTKAGKILVTATVKDDSNGYLRCTFFNQAWRTKQLHQNFEAVFFGKVEVFQGQRQMTNPVVDVIGDRTGRIIPIYQQSEKHNISTWDVASWVEEALERAGEFADPLPEEWKDRLDLVDRTWAFAQIHAPETMGAEQAARRRLAMDELLRLQMTLVMRKRAVERDARGIRHVVDGDLVPRFHAALPFDLTDAQRSAIAEISADLAGPHPMHRLLQGDVGSGKTVVAVTALLTAVQGGFQGAFMAPTEVLAEQHFITVRRMLDGLMVPDPATLMGERPLRVELLTNRTSPGERTKLSGALAAGEVDLLIGTHALLSEGFDFKALGMIVIDEQHRFGVEQRSALRGKGSDADVLVMTATPIPRTAAMTVYGDLDMTVLDALPSGRKTISTLWVRDEGDEADMWDRVRAQIAAGHQAYVVCPLIEESEKVQEASAEDEYERLRLDVLTGLRLGLLHGRMPAKEKEAVMTSFRRGELDVLVSTTVIEVGVDVPNATVMVIEDADRFGLAQLHQLRGRVGRGADASYCYLMSRGLTPDAEARLKAMVDPKNDGFQLAEVDLELRGEGTILGAVQKGRTDLKLASLRRDKDLVNQAREIAFAIVDADPTLASNPLLADEVKFMVDPAEAEFLFKS